VWHPKDEDVGCLGPINKLFSKKLKFLSMLCPAQIRSSGFYRSVEIVSLSFQSVEIEKIVDQSSACLGQNY